MSPETAAPKLPVNLVALLRDLENEFVDEALRQTQGNRSAAAKLLGLRRTTLVEKLRRRTQKARHKKGTHESH